MQNISVFEMILNEARAGGEEVDAKGHKDSPTTPSPNTRAQDNHSFCLLTPGLFVFINSRSLAE